MPPWLLFVLSAVAFTIVAGWVARKLLDDRVGWIRALVVSLVVFVGSVPLTYWTLQQSEVVDDAGRLTVPGPVGLAFFALIVGWTFGVVAIVLVIFEFLLPTGRLSNPVAAVRAAFRRRDRARRYAQILTIASRHGLGFYQSHRRGDDNELPSALVSAMNDAGVTFVKLGQVLSSREDVLPRELIDAFSTLQMDSTPLPWEQIEAAITAELHRPVDEAFAWVDHEPLAAASVAQVHAARLHTGEEVVIKVQRPTARAQVTTDLDIIERLAAEAEARTEWARSYGAAALAKEFGRALTQELDYRVEIANLEMLRSAIERADTFPLGVPDVYPELSTQRMIVQDRVDGVPLGRLAPDAVTPDTARMLAGGILDSVFDQIAVRGVFHADLHPGNLILTADGGVSLIDFGSVGVLEASTRRLLVPLLVAIACDDDIAATDAVLMLTVPEAGAVDQTDLQRDVGGILTRLQNGGAGENVFSALLEVLRAHRLALPPSLLLVFRTLTSLEGTLRRLSPGFDLIGEALQRAPKVARSMMSPRNTLLSGQAQLALGVESLRRMPRRWDNVSRSLEDGTFSLRLRAFEAPAERWWVEGLIARVTSTIIGVGLLATGIALAVSPDGPMMTDDVAIFPFLGSTVGLAGILLVVRSLREGLRRRDS
ncbi:AarF/UbiB family protein [Planococcus sp. APC 4015]|nr:AarF/UbiB family protein [Planococcus sp. APC 4015]